MQLGFPERGNSCPWSWDSMNLGSFWSWELGEGGSCGCGIPAGFQEGFGVAPQVQQYLRHSQPCSRLFPGRNLESLPESPEIQPKTSTLHLPPSKCSSGSVQGSGSAWDITKECFFPDNNCNEIPSSPSKSTTGSISSDFNVSLQYTKGVE